GFVGLEHGSHSLHFDFLHDVPDLKTDVNARDLIHLYENSDDGLLEPRRLRDQRVTCGRQLRKLEPAIFVTDSGQLGVRCGIRQSDLDSWNHRSGGVFHRTRYASCRRCENRPAEYQKQYKDTKPSRHTVAS